VDGIVLSYIQRIGFGEAPLAGGFTKKFMKNKYLYLALSIVSLVIGLGAMFSGENYKIDIIEGIFKGLAGVFFILYYILMLLGKEPLDKTTH